MAEHESESDRKDGASATPVVVPFDVIRRRDEGQVPYDDGEPDDDGPGPAAA